MTKSMLAKIKAVEGQQEVFDHDFAAHKAMNKERAKIDLPEERSPRDVAIDGVAHHVFNTLRGPKDSISGVTYDEIRAVIAEKF